MFDDGTEARLECLESSVVDDTIPEGRGAVDQIHISGYERWIDSIYTHIAEMENDGIGESKLIEFVTLYAIDTLDRELDSGGNQGL
jgi:hypothetical protein